MAPARTTKKVMRSRYPKWAITGNIGAGKSTVANLLTAKYGWRLVDADHETKALYRQDPELRRKLAEVFGDEVLVDVTVENPAGTNVDRRVLGEIVFADDSQLKRLNGIVHQQLIAHLLKRIEEEGVEGPVVFDAALVIEWGMISLFDKVILVTAPDDLRIERIITRSGGKLLSEKAWARLRTQMPQEDKIGLPGVSHLANDSSIAELSQKLEKLIQPPQGTE